MILPGLASSLLSLGLVSLNSPLFVSGVPPLELNAFVHVDATRWSGHRFEITERSRVTAVGFNLSTVFNTGSFFAAIVSLDGPGDRPDSRDLSTPDVLATEVFTAKPGKGDVFAPMEIDLEPGWYLLAIGSDAFGASAGESLLQSGFVDQAPDQFPLGMIRHRTGWFHEDVTPRFIVLGAPITSEPAFLEGHVFDRRTQVPVAGAEVRVLVDPTPGLDPIELEAALTDANGFFQFRIDDPDDLVVRIDVACGSPRGVVRGEGRAELRPGNIRRDVYLDLPRTHRLECR